MKLSTAQKTRVTEKQKKYLIEVFQTDKRTGRKGDPCNVSNTMRKATNPNGTYIFDASSYLISQQIARFFSRLAAKKNVVKITPMKRWR